jgi:hypothetical protein
MKSRVQKIQSTEKIESLADEILQKKQLEISALKKILEFLEREKMKENEKHTSKKNK